MGQKDPLEQEMATHSSILAWRIPWRRSLAGCGPWDGTESDMTEHTHNMRDVFFLIKHSSI